MVMFKNPVCGCIVCIFMIFFNVTYNMAMTYYYELKIGYINVHNYEALQVIVAKPWAHTQCVGLALIFVLVYCQILEYRKISPVERAQIYPILTSIHESKRIGWALIIGAFLIIFLSVNAPHPAMMDP